MSDSPSRETTYRNAGNGVLFLLLGLGLVAGSLAALLILPQAGSSRAPRIVFGIAGLITSGFVFKGLELVQPNQSKVVVLFGRYIGTLRSNGFFWINPFATTRVISLRAHNFNSDKLKVNDRRGNPIEIGAVVVWRVANTAQAAFDVENFESYVEVQTESALRHLASLHPYDTPGDDETSLRGSSDAINTELQQELEQRLTRAGIEVLEARLSHLAYAPEIAGAMLQRQQAEAIIDARKRIVDGAVGMVQMAIEQLQHSTVVNLDDERRAQMVANLLVVLCSERGTQPVVNTGTLYG